MRFPSPGPVRPAPTAPRLAAQGRRSRPGYSANTRDHSPMCGRYVTPDEAAMERAYNLTARQWEAWINEAYRPSYNVAPPNNQQQ